MRKYKNKKCSTIFSNQKYDFDSKAEMIHFLKLCAKLEKFEIDKLRLQPQFILSDPFKIATTKTKSGKSNVESVKYTPDFAYIDKGKNVVVEVKGMQTTAYMMRLRLFLIQAFEKHNVDTFIEVQNGKEVIYDCASVIKR